jgi:hypothetical protein
MDILSHRVGISSSDLLWILSTFNLNEITARLVHLDSIPGGFRRRFTYSNLLYASLEPIFDGTLSISLEKTIAERILCRLAMRHSIFDPSAPAAACFAPSLLPFGINASSRYPEYPACRRHDIDLERYGSLVALHARLPRSKVIGWVVESPIDQANVQQSYETAFLNNGGSACVLFGLVDAVKRYRRPLEFSMVDMTPSRPKSRL